MSTVKTGWLKDNNGEKFAPKTLSSQVVTNDGNTLESKLSSDLAIIESNLETQLNDKISNLINGAPTTLDTLGEIATAMAENADVVEALEESIGTKANASDLTSHTGNKSNPHGVTLAQLGVTATATELNKLDGVTATTAEINKLKGLTSTTTELNYVDGVTSAIQTQLDGKAASSHNHDASNITSGTLSSDRLPTVPIANGGTGATTAANARTNLEVYSKSEINNLELITIADIDTICGASIVAASEVTY